VTVLPTALARWVELPGPGAVLAVLRERAERGHRLDDGTLKVVLTEQQRREVGRLLGTRWEVSQRPVNLRLLAARLAEHGFTTLALVEAVGGPIVVRREARERAREQALAARDRAAHALMTAGVPEAVATAWSADVAIASDDIEGLATIVAGVWRRLPGERPPVRLAQLAADVLHDAHALDATTPAGRALARLAAAVHGLPRPYRSGPEWRAAWRSVGVSCDTASSRVLALNLPLHEPSAAATMCASMQGEPVWLTQRMLDQGFRCATTTVFVCENPTVVEAAADGLGQRCPPLVCTDGIATTAATDLIAGIAAAGCLVIARADFDEAGLVVVDQIRAAAPDMRLWRFDQATYAQFIASSLSDAVRAAVNLRSAIKVGGAVHEERLLDLLLDDLRHEATRGGSANS
jgi:uncharacterized protein (TIGR02679 family)